MLGIVFTSLADMVETQYGLSRWNSVLQEAEVPNSGAYTVGGHYSDDQLIRILHALSNQLAIEQKVLLKLFGEYLFHALIKHYPDITKGYTSSMHMLMHVDDQIHKELAFYHPQDARFPYFSCEQIEIGKIRMRYRSARKLCFLAEGLMTGVGQHFNENIQIEHNTCSLYGCPECIFELTIS